MFVIIRLDLLLFSLSFFFSDLSAAQTKKCGNEACDGNWKKFIRKKRISNIKLTCPINYILEILFQGKVHREQNSTHPNFLAYKEGDVIKVYAIELNDRVDLWEGEVSFKI